MMLIPASKKIDGQTSYHIINLMDLPLFFQKKIKTSKYNR